MDMTQLNIDDIYVLHCNGAVVSVGTRSDCETILDDNDGDSTRWHINSIEDYGHYSYNNGWEAASYETFA